ncbi:hypothetical protein PENTCL1PPCAC_21438, partial [Pristionchus entomophagus]
VENLCAPIPFNKLHIALNDDHVCIKLFYALVKSSKLENKQVFLDSSRQNQNNSTSQDVKKIRAMIMQFPKIDALKLDFAPLPKNSVHNNDETFLHVVSNTNHVELGEIYCSAQ